MVICGVLVAPDASETVRAIFLRAGFGDHAPLNCDVFVVVKREHLVGTPTGRHMIQNDVLDSAKLEGKIEGKIEGRLEGRAEGREEGREEGIKEGVLRNARRMKEKGFSTEDIMEITGLTFEEVSQL